jgi:hypothetical protein
MPFLWTKDAPQFYHPVDRLPEESDEEWTERLYDWQEYCEEDLLFGLYAAVGPNIHQIIRWARLNGWAGKELQIIVGEVTPWHLLPLQRLVKEGEDFVLRPKCEEYEEEGIVLVIRAR